ncbi:MAG: hypothetical protein Q9210_000591 [Variospora velana]
MANPSAVGPENPAGNPTMMAVSNETGAANPQSKIVPAGPEEEDMSHSSDSLTRS